MNIKSFCLLFIAIHLPCVCKASATQTVTLSSSAINELALSTTLGALTISSATAGSLPNSVSTSGSYNMTTNGSNMKITGNINSNMPSNLRLLITMTAPTGATSLGSVSMTTTAASLVNTITRRFQSNITLQATLQQTAAVARMSAFTRTLTLTLIQGP